METMIKQFVPSQNEEKLGLPPQKRSKFLNWIWKKVPHKIYDKLYSIRMVWLFAKPAWKYRTYDPGFSQEFLLEALKIKYNNFADYDGGETIGKIHELIVLLEKAIEADEEEDYSGKPYMEEFFKKWNEYYYYLWN